MRLRNWMSVLFSLAVTSTAFAQQRPNVIIIISDDHAFQAIGAYGNKLVKTPGIDRIAQEGTRFDRAYVTNSLCGPSRATILTGKYSHKNGFKDNDHSRFDGSQPSFIKELTQNGYQTAWIGKWHLETKPQGFSHWEILPGQGQYYNPDFIEMDSSISRASGYVSNIIEDKAENWLDQRDTTKPFCLVIGHKATHREWFPDTCDLGRYDGITFPLPANFYDDYNSRKAAAVQDMTIDKTMTMSYDLKMFTNQEEEDKWNNTKRMSPSQRSAFDTYYNKIREELKAKNLSGKALVEWKFQRYLRDYYSTVAALDRNISRTLQYLDKHQLTKNTIVIYMSDQGFFMGEHGWFDKRWMYEESFRTPMVMRYPGVLKPGTVNKDFVMNLDIAPTILDAAGMKVPADMQGESMLPLLKHTKQKGREAMYYHYYENTVHHVSPQFGIKTQRYKLIRFYERVDAWELFDLDTDKSEMHNLYGQKGYEAITAKLKKQLSDLITKYDDTEAAALMKVEVK
ncbi:sulfatase [Chitinophaga sp. Cy-1792]|uniref:sulfatase family protein n=1 Tax=Chitinophaga sp. Cy-1792 TaxID=2608339 RepID=UPI001423C072|nr:sulfatase [Chitinophaga sp. Cy-1792]NIG55783.1 sulfatase [Chitinophaga sp. Cy-1792]